MDSVHLSTAGSPYLVQWSSYAVGGLRIPACTALTRSRAHVRVKVSHTHINMHLTYAVSRTRTRVKVGHTHINMHLRGLAHAHTREGKPHPHENLTWTTSTWVNLAIPIEKRVGLKGGTGNWKLEMRKWEMRQYFVRPHVEQL